MARIPVLLNRGGGTVAADPKMRSKVAAAFKAAGLEAKVELIDGGKCAMRCRAIAERGGELVVVGGGDGTISAAASALVGSKTRLGILPLGTLNHFARDLRIPATLEEAVALIATGKERRVDVAEMNGRIFINNSAIGLYPLMVLDRERQQKTLGRSKRLAMLVASARMLARFGHQRLTLTVNDGKAQIDTPLLFVGNNGYRVDIGAPGQRESLEDGELSVFVMRQKTRGGFIAAGLRALLNRARRDDMVQLKQVERLRVASRKSALAVSFDGEVVRTAPPLDYKIRRKALRVVAP
jgi:diacylglycerol kinase family enzyme